MVSSDMQPDSVHIDAVASPPIGNASLVSQCPANAQRALRLVGQANPPANAISFIACTGSSVTK